MRVLLNVDGMSQYGNAVEQDYRASACGPTTAHVILKHHNTQHNVNDLYKLLGSTKIGMFKWRMIRNLRKLLGNSYTIRECSLTEAVEQLRHGYPVAMKFDKYTTLQLFTKKKPLFKYHWVPLIGYDVRNGYLELIIHDNGGRNRESKIRTFNYEDNQHVLSFVKIEPKK